MIDMSRYKPTHFNEYSSQLASKFVTGIIRFLAIYKKMFWREGDGKWRMNMVMIYKMEKNTAHSACTITFKQKRKLYNTTVFSVLNHHPVHFNSPRLW